MGVVAVAAGLSYVGAEHLTDLTLHHVGTSAALAGLWWTTRRAPLSDASFAGLIAFLLLHVVAAHWLYSFVPYDQWTEALFGLNLTETFGWRRNHFDRLVHFACGALVVGAVREFLRSRAGLRPLWARLLAIDLVVSTSAVYELIEWDIAAVADPAHAERYNGQQGDPFDAQKDMALAALGAVLATVMATAVAATSGPAAARRSAPPA